MHYSSRLFTLMWIVPLAVLSACSSQAAKDQGAGTPDRGGASSSASASGLATDTATVTPSFDCAKATLKVELAVCANPRLARLDGELTRLYDKAGKTPGIDRGQLQRLQGGWLNKRNACAAASDATVCLIDAYAGRIADLRSTYPAVNDDAGMSLGPIVWHCAGKPDVVSTFFNDVAGGDDSFVYLKWSGKAAVLEQAVSASGARYEGRLGDGDYEFWTKGNETQFSVPGAVGINCTETNG
ncbi:hypothetical protein AEAC466_00775 [Asticcacaulis sp. AC466]|uniref:MliC family protein n=1 Tax=Asticcacaulis sp. AC466 TaxID=1282362 RepID=UPI0003C3BB1C|nr:MliC family protein [Asticcacaulis sp. AC466]ESQ85738.1 hypothetical protein AEAC466_00775 [Asticcacaulis sp. AC466]